jgi:hypothetical protein
MVIGAVLLLIQVLLAIPWMWYLLVTRQQQAALFAQLGEVPLVRRGIYLVGGLVLLLALSGVSGPILLMSGIGTGTERLESAGRHYTAFLQLQLTLNLFLLLFWLILWLWPKGGAIALAAFFESVRQPMFWLLLGIASFLMFVWIIVPYFTFGEDYLVVKQLGYDTIMLAAVILGCLGASISISEEIEGRTAVTVMSKPVSRRQFMLGKFLGVALACLFLFGLLSVVFEEVLMVKHWWDKLETLELNKETLTASAASQVGIVPTSPTLLRLVMTSGLPQPMQDFLRGIAQWISHAGDTLPVLALCFSQVLVLVALSVALATRVSLVVNVVTVLAVYFLSHLTPKLLRIAQKAQDTDPSSPVGRILGFVAQVFDTILPDLGAFSMDPALLSEAPPPAGQFLQYVGCVTLYGVVYTGIVLLFGLILFEDRDVA